MKELFATYLIRLNLPVLYTISTISLLLVLLTIGLVKLIENKGNNEPVVAQTKTFQLFKHLARLVKWGLVIVGVIWGFASSIYSDEIKNAINMIVKVFRGQ